MKRHTQQWDLIEDFKELYEDEFAISTVEMFNMELRGIDMLKKLGDDLFKEK